MSISIQHYENTGSTPGIFEVFLPPKEPIVADDIIDISRPPNQTEVGNALATELGSPQSSTGGFLFSHLTSPHVYQHEDLQFRPLT